MNCFTLYYKVTRTVETPRSGASSHIEAKNNGRNLGFQEFESPRFYDSRHMKVIWLLALRTGRFYPPENTSDTHFIWTLSRPQGHNAAGRIK